jgi:hypothetical protein
MASNKLRNHPDIKRSGDGFLARLSAIKVDKGWNVRVRNEALQEHIGQIATSLVNGGTVPALEIYVNDKNEIVIADGHCRNEGYNQANKQGAEFEWVPIREFVGNDADRVALMFTSAQGKPLTQYEQAEAFKRLKGFNWSNADIAKRVGRTEPFVIRMLKLANADSEVKQMVKSGKVSVGAAVKVVRKAGSKAGAELKQRIAKAEAKAAKAVKAGGKAKKVVVTERDVDSLKLPKKLQDDLIVFYQNLRENMGPMVYDEARSLVDLSDAELEGESAELSMALIVSLLRIGDEITKLTVERN